MELLFLGTVSDFFGLGFEGPELSGVGFFCQKRGKSKDISMRIEPNNVSDDN